MKNRKRGRLSIEEQVRQDAQVRNQRLQRINQSTEKDWVPVDTKNEKFVFVGFPSEEKRATFSLDENTTLLDLFQTFLPDTLLEDIWDSYSQQTWLYQTGGKYSLAFNGTFNKNAVLYCLAI